MMTLLLSTLLHFLVALQPAISAPTLSKRDADFESVNTHLDKNHNQKNLREHDKYFHESTFNRHYDGRFGAKALSDEDRRIHLTVMVQTYLSSMHDLGMETWLAHGTLLGWYWNRRIMPWDDDIDMQISERSMHHLANYYNMTVHHFNLPGGVQEEGGNSSGRDFLLEINPRWEITSPEDESNRIDGRWIDMMSGLYIDITTLHHNETAQAEGIEDAMMCKDLHGYSYDDIFPLRETVFECAAARVPFAYAEVLAEEYHAEALSRAEFNGYKFDEGLQEWVLMPEMGGGGD
jgi:hypothetical protein